MLKILFTKLNIVHTRGNGIILVNYFNPKKKQCRSSFLFIYGIILVNYFNQKKKNNVILLFYLFPPFVAVGKFMDLGQFYNITSKKKKKKKCLGEGFV